MQLQGKKSIYEQIVEEYAKYIRTGALRAGEALPSCRQLAGQLGINPNTVQRAWTELERAGLILTIPKKGAFVAGPPAAAEDSGPPASARTARHEEGADPGAEAHAALLQQARTRLEELRAAGLTKAELTALAEQIFGKSEGKI